MTLSGLSSTIKIYGSAIGCFSRQSPAWGARRASGVLRRYGDRDRWGWGVLNQAFADIHIADERDPHGHAVGAGDEGGAVQAGDLAFGLVQERQGDFVVQPGGARDLGGMDVARHVFLDPSLRMGQMRLEIVVENRAAPDSVGAAHGGG